MLTELKCPVSVTKANGALSNWLEAARVAVESALRPRGLTVRIESSTLTILGAVDAQNRADILSAAVAAAAGRAQVIDRMTVRPIVVVPPPHSRPDWCTKQTQVSVAEQTVCSTAQLAAADIDLNRRFGNLTPEQRQGFLAGRDVFLKKRQDCGADVACLDTAYRQRLADADRAVRPQLALTTSAPPEVSFWIHNGSTMRLTATGTRRRMTYEQPTEFIVASGGGPGTVLFDVVLTNDTYQGVAYTVRQKCSPLSYEVKGTISTDRNRIELNGQNPTTDAQCNVVVYKPDRMVFDRATATPGPQAAQVGKLQPTPAAPVAAAFKLFPNYYFEKADLGGDRRDQPTANDCERLCAQTPNCAKYEFYLPNPASVVEDRKDADRRPKCSLSTNKSGVLPKTGGASGSRVGVRN